MNKVIENVNSNMNNNIFIIVKGLVISIITTLISIFILACVLSFSDFSESNVPIAIIAITSIAILISTSISTIKLNKNGMINGGIIGLLYMFCLYLISSTLGTGFILNANAIIMIILGIIAGMIGGIVGVNIKIKKN